jgi:cohesin complex subunit SA-1/2
VSVVDHRAQLEREYEMNSIVSTFIRAIRARVINVRHVGIVLAHYGRLDATFDTCAKTIVDVLREEGMLNSKGEVVVSVGLQAIREVGCFVIAPPTFVLNISTSRSNYS